MDMAELTAGVVSTRRGGGKKLIEIDPQRKSA
jgi:hypothetical protein